MDDRLEELYLERTVVNEQLEWCNDDDALELHDEIESLKN